MYLLVIFLPFLSFLTLGLTLKFTSKKIILYLPIFCLFISCFISYIIFYEIILSKSVCTSQIFTWIDSNFLHVDWGFLFDPLTSVMLIVVLTISSLVHFYSLSYMEFDPHLIRFLSYLSLFTFFMLMLITADNYIQLFLGWEGVGLASYLLINFWHTRIEANKSAMKAIIINRIGDLGVILGVALIFIQFKTVEFGSLFLLIPYSLDESFYCSGISFNNLTLISSCLFIGAIGKSAQVGLHTWLPDAMEGPTPVSALIHAATMVTAGVFILLRSSPLLEYAENVLFYIAIIGALTAFTAATIGTVQNDLKKVIAYSTCSQLGYMVFSVGLSNYPGSLFHLTNHAFFKALLFLSAGSIIHSLLDEQDMRKMGGLLKISPISYIMIFIGSFSLMGFPFLTGFYSKDFILEMTYGMYKVGSLFAYWLGVFAAGFTSFYSIRLIYLTFWTTNNSNKYKIILAHESSWIILFPLIFLGICSIFLGYLFKELFIGLNTDVWIMSLFVHPYHSSHIISEFLPFDVKLIPVIISIFGLIFSILWYKVILFYINRNESANKFLFFKEYFIFYNFISDKWHFDYINNNLISSSTLSTGHNIVAKLLDQGIIEKLGPLGIIQTFKKIIKIMSDWQSGFIFQMLAKMIVIAIIFGLVIGYIFWNGYFDFGASLPVIIWCYCFFKHKEFSLEKNNSNFNNDKDVYL